MKYNANNNHRDAQFVDELSRESIEFFVSSEILCNFNKLFHNFLNIPGEKCFLQANPSLHHDLRPIANIMGD